MALPLELLEIIFNFCHLGCRQIVDSYDSEDPSLSDTLADFPYSLAAVDPVWNAILLRHRRYWTGLRRVIFYVDSKTPTDIDDAKTLLRHVAHDPDPDDFHQFHVAIIRKSKSDPNDAAEKEQVRNLMDLLAPELERFKSFLIDVHASSSLPSVTTYFNITISSSIQNLEYLCDVDDSSDTVCREPYDIYFDARPGSHITSVVLDGYTFRRNRSWLQRHVALKSLTVSHLSHGTADLILGNMDVHRALETVYELATTTYWRGSSDLQSLTFRDINFASHDSMLQAFSIFFSLRSTTKLHYLIFEDVDAQFLEGLTRSIFANADHDRDIPAPVELHLMCGATSRKIPIHVESWQYARLVLEGYDQPHLATSYPFDQTTFPSSELHLKNCPGFTDTELEILSRIDAETNHPLCSTNLKSLKLTGCNEFSIQALKNMVNARAMLWREGSRTMGWENRRLNSLEVSGYGAPLSQKDKDWFRIHVKDFSWDSSIRRRSLRKLTVDL